MPISRLIIFILFVILNFISLTRPKFFCETIQLDTINFFGKWELEYYQIENENIIFHPKKKEKITLYFFKNGMYKKRYYQYNPLDSFGEEFREVNTVTDRVKKEKNLKKEVVGHYLINDEDCTISLIMEKTNHKYLLASKAKKMIITQKIQKYGEELTVICTFKKI